MTLPDLPDLPDAPGQDATYDERMRHFEATMRLAEYEQRERLNAAAEIRRPRANHRAWSQRTRRSLRAQARPPSSPAEQQHWNRRPPSMVELMEETPPGSPPEADGTSDRARVVVTAMMAETDKPPAEVVSAVQARIGAADSLLDQ
jgi:hypothetical protein